MKACARAAQPLPACAVEQAYLASESESSDEEQHPEGDVGAEAVRQRYQAFLLGPEAGAGARGGKSRDRRGQAQPDEEEEEEEGDTRGATRDKGGLGVCGARDRRGGRGPGMGRRRSMGRPRRCWPPGRLAICLSRVLVPWSVLRTCPAPIARPAEQLWPCRR